MLGIRRRAAIAADKQFATIAEGVFQEFVSFGHSLPAHLQLGVSVRQLP
jgi:hypothetical protein